MSGEQIAHTFAKATGWPPAVWLSEQLHHTVWNGFTFYDMIFPLFLFIAGVSMPFSFSGKPKKGIYITMVRRTMLLIVLGMVVNGLLKWNGYENTRFASVLGRIGLAWFFAGLIYLNFGLRGQIVWFVGLLLGYWAVMMWVPVPGYGAGVLTMQGSLESYIDRLLLPGRLHDGVHDPEGILSTIPAIGTALLGVFTGTFLRHNRQRVAGSQANAAGQGVAPSETPGLIARFTVTPFGKGLTLFAAGLALLAIALLWDLVFPINKRLWTSSFVLYTGGWSLIFLSVFYLVIDVWGLRKWAVPFIWIGTNAIVIYLASEGLVNFGFTAAAIFGGLIQYTPPNWQPVWTAVSVTVVQLGFLYFLYRHKLFLKI